MFLGNSWGCDDQICGMGYGYQEEFWNCADIRIERSDPFDMNPSTPAKPVFGNVGAINSDGCCLLV